jgi:replicative DNA helicase
VTTLASSPTRTPAHDIEAEEAVLGAMLLSPVASAAVVEMLSPADFYKPAYGHLFAAMQGLFGRSEPIDHLTVIGELRTMGLLESFGEPSQLIGLQNSTPSIANARHYAKIVVDHGTLRRLQSAAYDIAELSVSSPADVDAVVDTAQELVHSVQTGRRNTDPFVSIGDVALGILDRIDRIRRGEDLDDRVGTGLVARDAKIGGFYRGNLVLVGGRPGMGKTALATAMALHVALEERQPTVMFSHEMSNNEIGTRQLSQLTGISSKAITDGAVTNGELDRLVEATSRLQDAPLYLEDAKQPGILNLRAHARIAEAKYGKLGLVVVDYIQLLTSGRYADNRVLDVGEISRQLKLLAGELDTCVVALSQLNRALEHRAEKVPTLADLRESGSLEQDADIVLFPYRPSEYDDSLDPSYSEIHVAKHRNGETGVVKLAWEGTNTRFSDVGGSP